MNAATPTASSAASPYDQAFYDSQMHESLASARIYLAHFWKYFQATSVVDVGCGRGMWLKAAGELGARRLVGLDGDWNRRELMVDPAIEFRSVDLNRPFVVEKCDLAISLEVAEHLDSSSARGFVASLVAAADVVVFGAAFTGQGGTHHVNEQPGSYWAAMFADEGLRAYDVFRPTFWSDSRIPFWYRQNTFVYSRRPFELHEVPIAFMDCVHPELFAIARQQNVLPSLKDHFVAALRSRLRL